MNGIGDIIRNENVHAAFFSYNGKRFVFSGWWLLDWGDGEKKYESREAFLSDPFFDGRTLDEIAGEVTDVDYELNP